ncbi:reverse transcriptase domain-containing protein [Tanacetum coccineum]
MEDVAATEPQETTEVWKLFTDGSSNEGGFGAGLILTNLEGVEFTYALRFEFKASNNEAEYKALLAGLRFAKGMGIKHICAFVKSKLIANQINNLYQAKEETMQLYLSKAKDLITDEVTWMEFGGNTRDLGSFGEETDKITTLHQES